MMRQTVIANAALINSAGNDQQRGIQLWIHGLGPFENLDHPGLQGFHPGQLLLDALVVIRVE